LFCTVCGKPLTPNQTACSCGASPKSERQPVEIIQLLFRVVAVLLPVYAFWILLTNLGLYTGAATYSQQTAGGYTITSSAAASPNLHKKAVRAPAQPSPPFEQFYANLRSAIQRQDQAALLQLMSPRFQWAADGITSREEAIDNIGRIIGWPQFWQGAALALSKPPEVCDAYCWGRTGYRSKTTVPMPLVMVFELGPDNQWRWTALPGD
jgi:predicted nucleic acid-binding Zn ribbon protein